MSPSSNTNLSAPAALPTDLLKRFARAVDRKRRMDGFPEVSCKGHLQHGRIEKRPHEWYSSAVPEACAQIASTDVPVRPMNGSAIDRVFRSDNVAAKYQEICTHKYARTVIDAAHDQSSGPGSMAVVDDTRDFGGRPVLPTPDA
jgi:hypothetical protein